MIEIGSRVRIKKESFEEFKSYFTQRGVRLGDHYTVHQTYAAVNSSTHYYLLFEGFREWFNSIDFEDVYISNLDKILT